MKKGKKLENVLLSKVEGHEREKKKLNEEEAEKKFS